jgi:hypothetical protein
LDRGRKQLGENDMMDPDDLYDMLAIVPFQPVRFFLKDGRTHDIRNRELVCVGVTWVDLGTQAPGEVEGIWGSWDRIPLTEVDRVEYIPLRSPVLS